MISPLDYESVGLISGLEVHQQLLTRQKLFCRCPSGIYTQTHDAEVLRHMRPTLSELGVYDGTALMEFKTKKEIVYLLNHQNVCTYEMDDTPPFLANQDAIDVAIELCLMMHMDVIDEVHIARKQYLDGSIPTGFQRTAIVGVNGWLPFRGRRLTVTHLSVEEDSSREVSNKGHRIVFRTDRLGMPLTETVTGPDLRTPDEVREAILLAGLVSRSTRRVRVGIGAARQDVNVSVRGGRRVEIKGVSKALYAVKLVHNEAVRQVNLLKLAAELRSRGLATEADVRMHQADVTGLFGGAEIDIARRAAASGGRIYAVRIEGIEDLARHPTQPGLDFMDELEGRLRVIACLDQPPVVMDGRRLPGFRGMETVRDAIRQRLGVGASDEFFLVWGPEQDCRTAVEEIRLRWVDATQGVPNETRKSLLSGLTTFERILPGPDRMYPDTDSPPTRVTTDRVERIRARLAKAPWEREQRYGEWGVPLETTHFLIRRGGAAIVDEVVKRTGASGRVAAIELGQGAKAMKRAGIPVDRLGPEEWVQIFDLYTDARLPREAIHPVAAAMARNPGLRAQDAAKALGVDPQPPQVWQGKLDGLSFDGYLTHRDDSPDKRERYLIGRATRLVGGGAAACDVAEFVRQGRLAEGRKA